MSARRGAPAALAIGLALAGCGGDDEGRVTQEGSTGTATSQATATAPATRTEAERTDEVTVPGADSAPTTPSTSPEDAPGGAGDEQPARAPAQLTGRGGRITPALVRVPPFIAVRVQLRAADGREYRLRGGGKSVRPGRAVDFAGLRTGERLVLRGPQGSVVIEASAEPGP